ncbi:hypothetical protein bcgnr5372_38370 [Bacillus luti]|nr:hypothetical protein [Bacillus cereus]HDR8327221.1 hypothetical protein [Bacillus cereus]HDR8336411.1 hypothetical protein [Bacillus cereus]
MFKSKLVVQNVINTFRKHGYSKTRLSPDKVGPQRLILGENPSLHFVTIRFEDDRGFYALTYNQPIVGIEKITKFIEDLKFAKSILSDLYKVLNVKYNQDSEVSLNHRYKLTQLDDESDYYCKSINIIFQDMNKLDRHINQLELIREELRNK